MKKLNKALCAFGLITALFVSPALAQDAADAAPVDEPAPAGDEAAAPVVVTPPEAAPEEEKAAEEPKEEAKEEEKSEGSAASRLLAHAVDVLIPLLMLIISWAGVKIGAFFTKKTKIEIPAAANAMLEKYAEKGLNYAREQAHKFIKEKGEKMRGPAKMESALGFAFDLAEDHGYDDKAKAKIAKYIESKLGEERYADELAGELEA